MPTRLLENDDLGELGEAKLRSLCAAASLVCNKADRDKMGWDFVVESVPQARRSETLDQRRSGLSCRIQVKTQWRRDRDRVSVKLSAAERLAKDPGPAFLCIFTVLDDLTIKQGHLVPMLDESLARVLERLRQNEAESNHKALNKQEITFGVSARSIPFELTGAALRDALEAACGPDPQAYIAAKGEQLRSLGYESGRYRLTTTLKAESVEALVDMFLGVRPLGVTALSTHDVRFGIAVPVDHLPKADRTDIWLKPHPQASCTIRVRGAPGTPAAVFKGDVVFSPELKGLPAEQGRVLVSTALFTLDFRGDGQVRFDAGGSALNEARRPLSEWIHWFRLMEALRLGCAVFELVPHHPKVPAVELPIRSPLTPDQMAWAKALAPATAHLRSVLELAGAPEVLLTLGELTGAYEAIETAHDRLTGAGSIQFKFDPDPSWGEAEPPNEIDLLLADLVPLGELSLAYTLRVTLAGTRADDRLTYRQTAVQVLRYSAITDAQAYQAFVEKVAEDAGLTNHAIREYADAIESDPAQ